MNKEQLYNILDNGLDYTVKSFDSEVQKMRIEKEFHLNDFQATAEFIINKPVKRTVAYKMFSKTISLNEVESEKIAFVYKLMLYNNNKPLASLDLDYNSKIKQLYIRSIVINTELRLTGYGSEIVKELKKISDDNGFFLSLECEDMYYNPKDFWIKNGFKIIYEKNGFCKMIYGLPNFE